MSVATPAPPAITSRPRTLVALIHPTTIEAALLAPDGRPLTERRTRGLPAPASPEAVLPALWEVVETLGELDRISLGCSAPGWDHAALARELERQSLRPARVVDAARLQWFPVIDRVGVELVITLDTRFETALFHDGIAVPGFAIGGHRFRKGKTYREYVAAGVLANKGERAWSRRVRRMIDELFELCSPRKLYLAGEITRHLDLELPPGVSVIGTSNLLGGLALWQPSAGVAPGQERTRSPANLA